MTPLVGCEQCQHPIRDGNAALVLLSADLDLPGPHPALPVVVHRECLEAFHERKPTRWQVWGTVREFLRQVTLAVSVDDIQKERAERKQPKKKATDGFAA